MESVFGRYVPYLIEKKLEKVQNKIIISIKHLKHEDDSHTKVSTC